MDVSNFVALKKKLAKEPKKKKGTGIQKPVDDFFKKDGAAQVPEGEGPSKPVDAGADAGGSKAELKRKNAGKGVVPPEKKKRNGGAEKKDAPIVVAEEQSSSSPPAMANVPPPSRDQVNDLSWPRDNVQFSITKGTTIMHGTLNPREFLRGATPPTDKSVLSRVKDDALGAKVLQASVTAALRLSELLQRMEQSQAQKLQADEALAESRRQLQEVQETLWLEKEAFNKILENSKTVARAEGRAEGKAEAEKAATEAAKKAAEGAEVAKEEAVTQAKKDAVVAFTAEGWKTEEHKQWLASVMEASVDEWVKGPGAMWLAQKGKDYYDGGEFFTQNLIYRRLARHLKIEPKEFDPAAYGLPPLQPDVRIPLPSGEERPNLKDSELMQEGNEEETGEDAASKPEGGDDAQLAET
ncbi:unnamed protein product [Cuscuta epithymum]|uniref:Uncharacterized protein n=1 Tax=Cuscuta epithymum TaxID=186058 RepID=A0AAV0GIJ7_9ASTE|nr:unnamed protein product [Cuscuta epithymum]CAH9147740.1 unnamed protein product [Cuscuta epithymum]